MYYHGNQMLRMVSIPFRTCVGRARDQGYVIAIIPAIPKYEIRGWKLLVSDTGVRWQLVLHDDVIIWAAVEAHSKMRNQFTQRRSHLFKTKLAQGVLPGEL